MGSPALDLANQILRRLSWPVQTTLTGDSVDKEVSKVLDILNVVGQELGAFYAYPFLRKTFTILTSDDYSTGTAKATLNSQSVTFPLVDGVQATLTPGMVGGWIKFSDRNEIYRILSVELPTICSITPAYNGTSHGTDGVSFTIGLDTYVLPVDFDRPFADVTQFIATPPNLRPIEPAEMHRRKAGTTAVGIPDAFTINYGEDNRWYLVLDPTPDIKMQIKGDYVRTINKVYNDEDTLPYPLRMEGVIVDACIYLLKRDAQNDLQSASLILQDYLRRRSENSTPTSVTPRMRITPSTECRQRQQAKAAHTHTSSLFLLAMKRALRVNEHVS